MHLKTAVCAVLGLSPLLCVAPSQARAQKSQTPLPVKAEQKLPVDVPGKVEHVRVRHVPVRVLAFWLDASRQPEPLEFRRSRDALALLRPQSAGQARSLLEERPGSAGPRGLKMREGAEKALQLRVLEGHNAVSIVGPARQLSLVNGFVHALDQPMPQVESEALFVRLRSWRDADRLMAPAPIVGQGAAREPLSELGALPSVFGLVPGWEDELARLRQLGRARLLASRRVVTFSGMAVKLAASHRALSTVSLNARTTREVPVDSSSVVVAVPTAHADNTVPLLGAAGCQTALGAFTSLRPNSSESLSVFTLRNIGAVGFSGGVSANLAAPGTKFDLIIITPKIVRPSQAARSVAGEDAAR
jgi:hypothetical protein